MVIEYDYLSARRKGVSEEDIARGLSEKVGYPYEKAVQAGLSPEKINQDLFERHLVELYEPKPKWWEDFTQEEQYRIVEFKSRYNQMYPESNLSYRDIPNRPGLWGKIKEVAAGINVSFRDVAPEMAGRALRNIGEDFDPTTNTALDRFIQEQQEDQAKRIPSVQNIAGDELAQGVYEGGLNAAPSALTMAAGMGAMAIPGVGPALSAGITGVGTYGLFYGQEKDQFLEEVADHYESELGRKLTKDEWTKVHNVVENAAVRSGLYEGGTEAAQTMFTQILFGSPIGRNIGKMFATVPGKTGKIASLVGKSAIDMGSELAGETAAQKGQVHERVKAGLLDPSQERTWGGALKEIAVPTMVGAGLQAGIAGGIDKALNHMDKQDLLDDDKGFNGETIPDDNEVPTPGPDTVITPEGVLSPNQDNKPPLFPGHLEEEGQAMAAEIQAQRARAGQTAMAGPVTPEIGFETRQQNQNMIDALDSPGTPINQGQSELDRAIEEFRRIRQQEKEIEYLKQAMANNRVAPDKRQAAIDRIDQLEQAFAERKKRVRSGSVPILEVGEAEDPKIIKLNPEKEHPEVVRRRKLAERLGGQEELLGKDYVPLQKKGEFGEKLTNRNVADTVVVDDQDVLDVMQAQVNNSETKGENYDQDGNKIFYGASSPKWMENLQARAKGLKQRLFSRSEINTLIDKVRNGKALTKKQKVRFDLIQEAVQEVRKTDPEFAQAYEAEDMANQGFEPMGGQEVPAIELKPGSTFIGTVDGTKDTWNVKGEHNGNIVLQDGVKKEVDMFDTVQVDGIKQGQSQVNELQSPEALRPVNVDETEKDGNLIKESSTDFVGSSKEDFQKKGFFNADPKHEKQLNLFPVSGHKNTGIEKTTGRNPENRQPNKKSPADKQLHALSQVDVETTGTIQHDGLAVQTTNDAAGLLSHLAKKPQENLYTITVDKKGNVIEVHRYSKGSGMASAANAMEITGRILRHPDVGKVYFAHNHPSGDPTASPEDVGVFRRISNILRLKKIPLVGFVIGRDASGNGLWHTFDEQGGLQTGSVPPTVKRTSLPIKERVFIDTKTGSERLTGPDVAEKYFKNKPSGFLLLNAKNRPVGFLEYQVGMKAKDLSALIISSAEQTGAVSAIFYNENPEIASRVEHFKTLSAWVMDKGLHVYGIVTKSGDRFLHDEVLTADKKPKYDINENAIQSDEALYSTSPSSQLKTVHHGTPNQWQPEPGFPHGRPRLDKIGTGEGSQAYGWGIYTAEAADVAKHYAPRDFDYEDKLMELYEKAEKHEDYPAMEVYEAALLHETASEIEESLEGGPEYDDALNQLKKLEQTGAFYKLDIPDEILPKLLDWDKPLSEQTKYVKDRVKKVMKRLRTRMANDGIDVDKIFSMMERGDTWMEMMTGEQLYGFLTRHLDSDQKASANLLKEFGIPGNKHLDKSSTTSADGSKNYVLWDQKVLDQVAMLEKNGDVLDAIQYALRNQEKVAAPIPPGQQSTLSQIKKLFKGQSVTLNKDESVSIRLKNGADLRIKTVQQVSEGKYLLSYDVGKMDQNGLIAGKYKSGEIELVDNVANGLTLTHEVEHFLEDVGVLTKGDTMVMDTKIKRLDQQGKLPFKLKKDQRENRADFLAHYLADREAFRGTRLGKILQKIADFLDGLVHLGRSSVRKIARGIESGKIYSRDVIQKHSGDVQSQTIRNTATKAFKEWFKGSKVVDKNGDPLVVYHGTNADFDTFKESKHGQAGKGIYLTPFNGDAGQYGKNLVKAYVSLQNPRIIKRQDIPMDTKSFRTNTEGLGYDGVIITDANGTFDEIIAFSPTQIKSVYNRGTWSQTDPRIQYSTISDKKQTGQAVVNELFKQDKTLKDTVNGFTDNAKSKEKRQLAKDKFISNTLDRLHFIKQRLGDRAYKMHRVLTGINSASFAMFLEHGPLSWNGDALTVTSKNKGVIPFLKSIGPDWQNLLYWIAAKRAEELDAQGRENWITADKRKAIFDMVGTHSKNGKSWEYLNKRFQTINKNVLDVAEQAGLIDPEARAMWEQDFYIPFYRIFENKLTKEEFLSGPRGAKKHISAQIRQLRGGEAQIGDLLQNSLQNWMHLIDAAARNKARAVAFEAGKDIGIIEEVEKKDLVNVLGSKATTRFAVMKAGGKQASAIFDTEDEAKAWAHRLADKSGKEYNVEPRKTTTIKFGNMKDLGVLSFQKNGQPVYFKTDDEDLYRALCEVDNTQFKGFLMSLSGKAKRTLSYGATFGPLFRVNNMLRDTVHTSVVSSSFVPFLDTAKGFIKAMQESPEYIEYMASGFGFGSSYVTSDDPETGAKFIKKIVAREGQGALNKILTSKANLPLKLFHLWEKIGTASENAARVQLYSNLKKKGVSNFDAGFEGRDLMDFTMHGEGRTAQLLMRTIPFLNARFQGLYKLGKSAKKSPGPFFLKSSLLMAASLALWGVYKDDDRYKELEDWDKWSFFHFWWGKDHYRIPKPFEIGAFFCSLPTAIGDVMNGTEDKKFIADWAANTAQGIFNIGIPQLLKPVEEAELANKNHFTGRAIVPQYMQKLPKAEQYQPWTSETAREIGKRLGMSPLKIQHYIKGYFGTLGMIGLTAMDDRITRDLFNYPTRPAGEQKPWSLSRLKEDGTRPARNTKYVTKFYELADEVAAARATFNNFKKTDQPEKAWEWKQEKGDIMEMETSVNKTKRKLAEINAELKRIQRSTYYSAEEKRIMIDELLRKRNQLTKQKFQTIRQLKRTKSNFKKAI